MKQQSDILKLLFFIACLGFYLYCFDASFVHFMNNVDNVLDLHFKDMYFLNSAIWLIGLWGIILLLNSGSKYMCIASWIVFIASSAIGFLYTKAAGGSLTPGGIENIGSLLSETHLVSLAVGKIILGSSLLVAVFVLIKPAPMAMDKVSGVFVVCSFLLAIAIAGYDSASALQNFFTVPAALVYKYSTVLIHWLAGTGVVS